MATLGNLIIPDIAVADRVEFERPDFRDQAKLYVTGGPGQYQTSLWEQNITSDEAAAARTSLAAGTDGGNPLTFVSNIFLGIGGSSQEAVSIDTAQLEKKLLEDSSSPSFGEMISPVRRGELSFYREYTDPNFNFDTRYSQWREDNPKLETVLRQNGVDLGSLKDNVPNEMMFRYAVNFNLEMIRAEQYIESRNEDIGTSQWVREGGSGILRNYVLNDPTAAASAVLVVGQGIRTAQVASTLAKAIARVPIIGRAAPVIARIGALPASLNKTLAEKTVYAFAAGVETGAWGAAYNAASQAQNNARWNLLFGDTDKERVFDYDMMFLSGGITGGMAFGLVGSAGLLKKMGDRVPQIRQSAALSAGQVAGDPTIVDGFDFTPVVRQKFLDDQRVRIHSKLELISPSNSTDAADFAWILDDNLLAEAGLSHAHMEAAIDEIADLVGAGKLHKSVVNTALQDYYAAAKSFQATTGRNVPLEGAGAIRYQKIRAEVEADILNKINTKPTRAETPGTLEFNNRVDDRVQRRMEEESIAALETRLTATPGPTRYSATPVEGTQRFFHGGTITTADLEAGNVKPLTHFGSEAAATRAKGSNVAAKVYPVDLTINKPVRMVDTGVAHIDAGRIAEGISLGSMNPKLENLGKIIKKIAKDDGEEAAQAALIQALKKQGYDSIRYSNAIEDVNSISVIILDPSQVKLAQTAGSIDNPKTLLAFQQEYRDLISIQQRRALLMDEEARLLALETMLAEKEMIPFMDDITSLGNLRKPAKDAQGNIKPASDRTFDLNKWKPTSEAGLALKSLMKIRTAMQQVNLEIKAARAAHGKDSAEVKALLKKRNNLSHKAVRLQKQMAEGAEGADPNLVSQDAIIRKYAANPPKTPTERINAAAEMGGAEDVTSGTLVTDVHAIGTLMRMWGLGDLFSNLMTQKTGQFQTTRSAFAAIRQGADLIDHSRWKVEALKESRPVAIGTFMDAQREAERLLLPLDGFIARLHEVKRFAKKADWIKFQKAVIRMAHGHESSLNPEVVEAAKLWKAVATAIGAEGVQNGRFGKLIKDFFPIRAMIGKVRTGATRLHAGITRHWMNKWLKSESIHYDTFVRMGWAKRVEDESGNVSWAGLGPYAGKDLPKNRLTLTPEQDAEYVKGLSLKNDRGETAIEESAWRAINNLMDEKTYELGNNGLIKRNRPGPARSENERVLDNEILFDPDLEEFFDWNLMDVAFDYTRTSGFDVKAQSAVQRLRPAIPGLTPDEYFESLGVQASAIAKRGSTDSHKIQVGLDTLKAKYNLMRGRTPRMISHTESIGEFVADSSAAGTLVFYGLGIGPSSALTEGMVQTFARMHTWEDAFMRIGDFFRSCPISGGSREFLQDLTQSFKLTRHSNAERFTAGGIESSFHYTTMSKLVSPYTDVWNLITGKTAPGGKYTNRFAAATIGGISAVGKTMLSLGLSDFFTNWGRGLAAMSLKRETARFLPAAKKLAVMLREQAAVLDEVERFARADAMDSGKSLADSIRIGVSARAKKFNGMAREAGFGGQWQIARRFSEAELLNPELLDAIILHGEASGSLRTTGYAMMDMTEMARTMTDLPADQKLLIQRGITQMQNSIETTIQRRFSDMGPLQTPTDPASLSYHGRALNTMFGFARTFADSNILEMASLPQRNGMMILGGFIVGEIMSQVAKRLLRGERLEDIQAEWEENPKAIAAKYLFRMPFLGQYTMYAQLGAEALLLGQPSTSTQPGSAATSVQGQVLRLTLDGMSVPAELAQDQSPRFLTGADKLSQKMIPGYGLFRAALGSNTINDKKGRRFRLNQAENLAYEQGPAGIVTPLLPESETPVETRSFESLFFEER